MKVVAVVVLVMKHKFHFHADDAEDYDQLWLTTTNYGQTKSMKYSYPQPNSLSHLTRSIRDSEASIDFVQCPPGSRRERVN